jgi:lipopolysaccharide transport system permease protein
VRSDRTPVTSTAGPLGWTVLLGELVRARELVSTFAQRDLRSKYKQTVLGIGWAVIQPLIFLVVFVVFFGNVAGFEEDTPAYAAFALSSLVAW